jgi:putative oxidoreductase
MFSTQLQNLPALVSRIILALFFIPGGIWHFSKDPAIYRNQFINNLAATNYMWQFIGVMLLISGIGLFIRPVQLIAILIALPLSANIFLFHIRYLEGGGLGVGIIVMITNLYLVWHYRSHFLKLYNPAG